MIFSIKAKFLSQTETKPSRLKLTNALNTRSLTICVNGDRWNTAEAQTDGKTANVIKALAVQYAESVLFWNYSQYHIAVLKDQPRNEYVIVPVDIEN